jgi:hypothetical protein
LVSDNSLNVYSIVIYIYISLGDVLCNKLCHTVSKAYNHLGYTSTFSNIDKMTIGVYMIVSFRLAPKHKAVSGLLLPEQQH